MRATAGVRFLTLASVAGLLFAPPARAEDTKGKWQFGFGLSYYSTVDYIRSNADLAISTGVVGENGLPGVGSVDDRPDINLLNQPSVKDNFKLDGSASYGLTRWLALEAAVGYLSAPVGNIEFYFDDVSKVLSGSGAPSSTRVCGPDPANYQACYSFNEPTSDEKKHNTFLPVGTITEIPVHLSGLVRFRPESPFDPYVGLGMGYIQTHLTTGDQFNERAREVQSLNVLADCEGDYTKQSCDPEGTQGPGQPFEKKAPFHPAPLSATVRNAFEWHAIGGVDYYLNERFSFYVDARYTWTSGAVNITTDGRPQVRFGAEDQGRLILLNQGAVRHGPGDYQTGEDKSAYYLWEDTGFGTRDFFGSTVSCTNPKNVAHPECAGDGLFETEDKNGNGTLDAGEDDGVIYVLPPGPFNTVAERFDNLTFQCAACVGNGPSNPYTTSNNETAPLQKPDSEDKNYNGYMDRFLYYALDLCSTPQGVGNPACVGVNPVSQTTYVWPENCPTIIPGSTKAAEGCPPPQDLNAKPAVTSSGVDSTADIYIIQGGRIHLGGFALGVGLKFTF